MARLLSVALLLALGATPGWSQSLALPNTPADGAPTVRSYSLPNVAPQGTLSDRRGRLLAGTEVGPGAIFGIGMFGLKRDKADLPRATGREINVPKTRHKGIGLSLSF